MKRLLGVGLLVFIGVAVWQIGNRLSSDAIGMAVGVLFGVMAGVPTALLVVASNRRRGEPDEWNGPHRGRQQAMLTYGAYPQQPPVIVLTGNAAAPQYQPSGPERYAGYGPYQPALTDRQPTLEARQFRVVGETEEWVEEWS